MDLRCDLRQSSRPEVGRNQARWAEFCSSTPRATQLCARMEGATAPDVLPRAVDFGIIDGRDVVSVPDAAGSLFDEPDRAPGDASGTPGPVLGEGLHRLPVGQSLDGAVRLGDGVLSEVEGQGGDPRDEASEAGPSEGPSEGVEQDLPDRPGELSFSHDASPVLGPDGSVTTWQIPTRRRGLQYGTPAQLLWSFSWKLLLSAVYP